jgi:murein L,D-transpeptidase YcbB/YkuD
MRKAIILLVFLTSIKHTDSLQPPILPILQENFGARMSAKLFIKRSWIEKVFSDISAVPIPMYKKKNSRSDSLIVAEKIKNCLLSWGDYKPGDSLNIAIKKFQRWNGMDTTGKPSNQLIRHLNLPKVHWLNKIEINAARMNQVNVSDSENLIWVNIPDFYLFWIGSQKTIRKHKVIVGQKNWETQCFVSYVSSLHFHPSWYVPPRIWEKEMKKMVDRDQGYLTKHHLVWENEKLRQTPGSWNSLGQIKIVVPNQYLIFLHGTPNQTLFKKQKRMFSHGCIRVQAAEDLAKNIFKVSGSNYDKTFDQYLEDAEEKIIPVKKNIPVLISYWTCWVDETGQLQNREDVYHWDGN